MSGFTVGLLWFLLFLGGGVFLAYRRTDLLTSTIATGVAIAAYVVFGDGHFLWKFVLIALFGLMVIPNLIEFRREKLTKPLLAIYRKMLPSMSDTEREALEAGNVGWDGELFSGMPEWDLLMSYPAPQLSEEEQAFLDGPCETLCEMLDDWEICHELADLPKDVWDYIIEHRFFAMIIPKAYGGLEFSAYANASIIAKIASRSPHRLVNDWRSQLFGTGRIVAALRYGRTEESLPSRPRCGNGDSLLCPDLTTGWIRRRRVD